MHEGHRALLAVMGAPQGVHQQGQTVRRAIDHARDLYTRRQEGISIWVVPSKQITASDPAETDSLFEPARDKIYRHPTFYEIPDEVKTL